MKMYVSSCFTVRSNVQSFQQYTTKHNNLECTMIGIPSNVHQYDIHNDAKLCKTWQNYANIGGVPNSSHECTNQ